MLKDILVKTNRYIKNRNNKKLSLLIKKYFFFQEINYYIKTQHITSQLPRLYIKPKIKEERIFLFMSFYHALSQ